MSRITSFARKKHTLKGTFVNLRVQTPANATVNDVPIATTADVTASNVTLAVVGSAPNNFAASLSGQQLTLQPADATHPGLLSAGAQSIGGNKTFTGSITASNITGSNSGDVTLAAAGSGTPNANGATLTGQQLNLEYASSTQPGLLSAAAQSIGGQKTFDALLVADAAEDCHDYLNLVESDSSLRQAGTRILHPGADAANLSMFLGSNCGNTTTTGGTNYGFGTGVFNSITGGSGNCSMGHFSSNAMTLGQGNAMFGTSAGTAIIAGDFNTGLGRQALNGITGGDRNIGIGEGAGSSLTGTDSDNICIGNAGVAGDSGVIRIGDASHTNSFFRGISGVTTVGAAVPVLVAANGELGTTSSARRKKRDIEEMEEGDSSRIYQLKPKRFKFLENDIVQYGLIAEDVADVMDEIVVYGNEIVDGQEVKMTQTIRYDAIWPQLLHQVQLINERLSSLEQK